MWECTSKRRQESDDKTWVHVQFTCVPEVGDKIRFGRLEIVVDEAHDEFTVGDKSELELYAAQEEASAAETG